MKPLAIVQARIGSTRLPRKMLLPLDGHPMIWHAWAASAKAFGMRNTIIAMPASAENDELEAEVRRFPAQVYRWDGPEDDVLGRFHDCAHHYRWHPDTVIVRVTPDDPWKVAVLMQEVAQGCRHPPEIGGEAFTLNMLDQAYALTPLHSAPRGSWPDLDDPPINPKRQHLSDNPWLFTGDPPPPPPGVWTIDTPEQYEVAIRQAAGMMTMIA